MGTLAEDLRAVLPSVDPVSGFELGALSKQEFVDSGMWRELDPPGFLAPYHLGYWAPDEEDCAIFFSRALAGQVILHAEDALPAPGKTLLRSVKILKRVDPTTLHQTFQWGGPINTTTHRQAFWDIGVRTITWWSREGGWPQSREVPQRLTMVADGPTPEQPYVAYRYTMELLMRDQAGRKPPLPPRGVIA